jgi:hypothetical protein
MMALFLLAMNDEDSRANWLNILDDRATIDLV